MRNIAKNFLSTVLVLSLLASFSVSIVSFAAAKSPGVFDMFDFDHDAEEEYILSDDILGILIDNHKVAKIAGIENLKGCTDGLVDYRVIYDHARDGLIICAMSIDTKCQIVCVPDTLFGKPILDFSDHMEETYFGDSRDGFNLKAFCVPKRLKEQMEEYVKKHYTFNGNTVVTVISYYEAKEFMFS